MADRQHTAECYRDGCKVGAHPSPRPGHVTGGPWTPEEVLAGKHLPVTADDRGRVISSNRRRGV